MLHQGLGRIKAYPHFVREMLHLYHTFRAASRSPGAERINDVYVGKWRFGDFENPARIIRGLTERGGEAPFRRPRQRPDIYFPFLTAKPFWDRDDIAAVLERSVDVIRAEFRAVDALADAHREGLTDAGFWTTYEFFRGKRRRESNCARCPETTRVIAQSPNCGEWAGAAFFSILEPGTHIKPHCGTTNGRLRYHLTIEAADGASIRVDDRVGSWTLDQCLILDDSFVHEVTHQGTERRVVLVVDMWHPELTDLERRVLAASFLLPPDEEH
ncbi:MAG: aspartyl/asparaginyl beta-hydroxylase domain-containing protein [Isosphaeraceae bacterium]|nr:aspartyl/asparaginyl beta-hydroxylase domain-containing protein [Isosphaeraceae bacterium]